MELEYEKTKKELKERFSKAIDQLNESEKLFSSLLNTPVKQIYTGFTFEQLLTLINTWPKNKETKIITYPWEIKKRDPWEEK